MIKDNKNYNEKVKPNTEFLKELKSKLPQFFINEKYDEEGNLISEGYFDIERFQESLRENNIYEIKEGYQLSFIGKDYAKKQAGEKPTTVVVPDNKHNQEEINKNSKNLFFTGDNLEVLRHLQSNYRSSVDVIYIDPPYNTGKDGFVYPDKFEYSDEVLQDVFGLNDNELRKLKSIQGKSTHSAWLTFMYPRLIIAKKILSDSGILFISIDDNEGTNLKISLDEIFGESNFITNFVWEKGKEGGNDSSTMRSHYESIVAYCKNSANEDIVNLDPKDTSRHRSELVEENLVKGIENDAKKGELFQLINLSKQKDYTVKIPLIDGSILEWSSYAPQKTIDKWIKQNKIFVGEKKVPYVKSYLTEELQGQKPSNIITQKYGTTKSGSIEIRNYFGSREIFSYPKPSILVKRLCEIGSSKKSIILDFFAGSATTADAVMQLNAEDGGNRQFIMVQIDEPTYVKTDRNIRIARKGSETAFNAGYMSIDKISRERIKRASQKIRDDKGLTLPENFDGGFKHYRVVKPTQASINDLETYDPNTGMFVDSKGMQVAFSESGFDDMIQPFSSEGLVVSGDATGVDTILTTWMIQDGYKLDNEVHQLEIDGYNVFYVEPTRVYLIGNNWNSNNTKMLLNKIGNYDLNVQIVVIYGYSFGLESIRELELGLKQLPNKVNLVKRY